MFARDGLEMTGAGPTVEAAFGARVLFGTARGLDPGEAFASETATGVAGDPPGGAGRTAIGDSAVLAAGAGSAARAANWWSAAASGVPWPRTTIAPIDPPTTSSAVTETAAIAIGIQFVRVFFG